MPEPSPTARSANSSSRSRSRRQWRDATGRARPAERIRDVRAALSTTFAQLLVGLATDAGVWMTGDDVPQDEARPRGRQFAGGVERLHTHARLRIVENGAHNRLLGAVQRRGA